MSSDRDDIAKRFDSDAELDRMIAEAVMNALAEHKRRNISIAVWREEKVVIVPPEEIEAPKLAE